MYSLIHSSVCPYVKSAPSARYLEMRFTILRHSVHVAFIYNLKVFRIKGIREFLFDRSLDGFLEKFRHEFGWHVRVEARLQRAYNRVTV